MMKKPGKHPLFYRRDFYILNLGKKGIVKHVLSRLFWNGTVAKIVLRAKRF